MSDFESDVEEIVVPLINAANLWHANKFGETILYFYFLKTY